MTVQPTAGLPWVVGQPVLEGKHDGAIRVVATFLCCYHAAQWVMAHPTEDALVYNHFQDRTTWWAGMLKIGED